MSDESFKMTPAEVRRAVRKHKDNSAWIALFAAHFAPTPELREEWMHAARTEVVVSVTRSRARAIRKQKGTPETVQAQGCIPGPADGRVHDEG